MASQLNYPATPPVQPLAMPTQNLKEKPSCEQLTTAGITHVARFIAFGGAFIIGSLGSWAMFAALGKDNLTALQWVLFGLFSLTFYWVSFSSTGALAGFLPTLRRRQALNPDGGKVAIVMPVYGEDPTMTGAALLTISQGLQQTHIASRCEIFIISDTQQADAWLKETAAFTTLRKLSPLPVWYRRRHQNIGRKAGNIEQFVSQWGGRYDYMLMLDADSLMCSESIETMVARMDAEPALGLLQSMPRLIGGESLLARTVQFASAVYGIVVARGVDAWQGPDGNYWGHNALIRMQAFAECCGLPVLTGRRPIGGHIMSHDFVEAALMHRGGWAVRMDADLIGSYEGLPPTITDLASRERRWAQGNLQHLGVITAKGLHWCNRAHFAIGILGYLMSPIWMFMMSIGFLITAQALFTQPAYFPLAHQLFPNWPTFDAKLMRELFFTALTLLLLPKFIGWGLVLSSKNRRQQFGGALTVTKGVFLELLLSTLYAPMLMLIQTHHVVDIFLGRDSGWHTQSRVGNVMPWKIVLRQTLYYIIIGLIPLAALIMLAPNQIIWLSPVLAGLLLAPWLARHSGNMQLGHWLAQRRWLLTPEEIHMPETIAQAYQYRLYFISASEADLPSVVSDASQLSAHITTLDENTTKSEEQQRLTYITARAKIEAAATLEQAIDFLDETEKLLVANTPELLNNMHQRFADAY